MLRLCGLAFEARNYDDGALLTLLRIRDELRESPRWVVTFNNCWEDDNPDYVIEWFGIEVGETEDIESFPYYRLKAAARDNQKMLIPLLRTRICHAPTMRDSPVYLEIINQGSRYYDVGIQGLDPHLNISPLDLMPIIKARDIHFKRPPMGLPLRNRKLIDRWVGFVRIAETLGSKGERFSIPDLDSLLKLRSS